jgi:hypothetical protein
MSSEVPTAGNSASGPPDNSIAFSAVTDTTPTGLGSVDKPVLAPARPERFGQRDTHVAREVRS